MAGEAFLERLKKQFGDADHRRATSRPSIRGSRSRPTGLVEVCRYLRDEPDLRFDMLNCITGVDYFEPDPKKAAKADWAAAPGGGLSPVEHAATSHAWC